MQLPDNVYNVLKWVVVIFLPALSTAVFALGQLLEWDAAVVVVGVLAILTTFLGSLIGLSSREYNRTA